MLKKQQQNKLMIVTGLRITEWLNCEILRVAESSGLSKRDVIRLAIQKGLPFVEEFAGKKQENQTSDSNRQEGAKK